MPRIRSLQRLDVQWVKDPLYTVSRSTMRVDRRRRCWICGEDFAIGDGVTVCHTEQGNKLMHSRCYRAQQEAT